MADRDLVRKDRQRSPASSPRGTNYLLAIAINDYQHCTKLNNAVLDAEAFIELLTSRYNFEAANVTFIKDTEATKRRIEQEFFRLIKMITSQDNLIVYFSGHGRHDEHFGGNWVPVDAGTTDDDWPDYLSNDTIKSYLSKIKSFHTFLIADSCFSGSLFIDKSKEKFSGDRRDTEPSRWGLTSGKKEIMSDGRPGHHSPFAAALLGILRKADKPLGVVSLCDQVMEIVTANEQQTPMFAALKVEGHQYGQYVFYFREDEEQAWATAQATNTIKAYTDFHDQYPHGKYSDLALDALDMLEEKEEWDQVPKNRQAALLRYIQQNPQSPYVTEARRLVDESRNAPATLAPKEVKRKEQPVLISPVPPSIIVPKLTIPEHMVLVKGGTFEMGDVMGDKEYDDETVHTVTLSNFLLAKNELTFDEYDAFCKATDRELPSDSGWGRGKRPVINVDWYDAVEYCNWRSGQEGLQAVYSINKNSQDSHNSSTSDTKKWLVMTSRSANGYRLPTEAEWEYAARAGGQKVRFGNGEDIANPQEINFDASTSGKEAYSIAGEYRQKTLPVGSFSPNTLELFDMSGNVYEWCGDWYGTYSSSASSDPQGAIGGSFRVIRGGSWNSFSTLVRVAYRSNNSPDHRRLSIGFRLARQQ